MPFQEFSFSARSLGASVASHSRQIVIATRAVFGIAPAAWLALPDVAALAAWSARGATAPARMLAHMLAATPTCTATAQVQLMPAPRREALLRVVAPAMRDEPAFARTPTWAGQPVETSALARMRAHPLVAALRRDLRARGGHARRRAHGRGRRAARGTRGRAARRGDRAAHAERHAGPRRRARRRARPRAGCCCIACACTSECVVDYQIVAPTEWNFHPDGALVRGLDRHGGDRRRRTLLRRARLAVHALDPCVACRVEIGHA